MKLGIIGLPGCGKSTVFRALTFSEGSDDRKGRDEPDLAVVKVEDSRLDYLAAYHTPRKVTPVDVEYQDIAGFTGEGERGREIGDRILAHMRPLDAMVHVIRFFESDALGAPEPLNDMQRVDEEMMLSDLAVIERRLERAERDFQKGRKELAEEIELLKGARQILEEEKPLRVYPPALESDKLRGFSFLSAKPQLYLVNAGENKSREDIEKLVTAIQDRIGDVPYSVTDWLYADAEAEIARLEPEEAREFMEDLELDEDGKNRIICTSFALLNLIVFFTAGDPEVRAWPLREGESALEAAGTVHTDMQRGFIRAEVVSFDDFKEHGSMQAAQKAGKVRLEGKEYRVSDGDIILFRFNV